MMHLKRFSLVITTVVATISGHVDRDASSEFSSADDMESELMRRNTVEKREWQYEGIPIDLPSRRIGDTTKIRTKKETIRQTSTTTVNLPNNRRYRRIYNADEVATIHDHPYLAALLVNDQLWCGGVILDSETVLTAAHCLQLQYNNRFFREYLKMLTIRIGSTNATSGGQVYRVMEIFFHPNYKPSTLEFNFALLKLHKNISFDQPNARVARIGYSTDKIVPPASQITFLGWGSILGIAGLGGQVLLQKVQLPVYDLADCQEIYGRDLVTRNNFCAGFITDLKNVCNVSLNISSNLSVRQGVSVAWILRRYTKTNTDALRTLTINALSQRDNGTHDAGGPAILDGLLVGILSFSSKRCDIPDQPAVFSTVGVVVPWLESLGEKKVKMAKTEIKSSDWANVRK